MKLYMGIATNLNKQIKSNFENLEIAEKALPS